MIRFSSVFSIALCAVLLTGCGPVIKGFSNDAPQLVAAPDSVSAMLADAADRASTALETLAAVEHSRAPAAQVAPAGDAPVELRRAMTVNWVGPAEQITKTLADRAGYKFQVFGNTPPVPIVISIDAENRPIIDILRDIGLQLGVRADVKVDSAGRVIEIAYPPTTGLGAGL